MAQPRTDSRKLPSSINQLGDVLLPVTPWLRSRFLAPILEMRISKKIWGLEEEQVFFYAFSDAATALLSSGVAHFGLR
ncbi:hypothetical protein F4778DRAFT_781338 [Xylariomycetidae sp. FL2044]|nr:hypothetical protein F4778DRAFT_781338 [Xylariomycetidae sp. FL2044]